MYFKNRSKIRWLRVESSPLLQKELDDRQTEQFTGLVPAEMEN